MIAPWNYPWSIPFGEVAIALMAGNGVVLKPAEPDAAARRADPRVFEKAGLPGGPGPHRPRRRRGRRGARASRASAKIFFTGSVEVGRQVGRGLRAADQGRRCSSSAARTRRSSAPTPTSQRRSRAASGAASPTPARPARGSSASTSSTTVADRFIEGVVRETERLTVGDPLDWETEIGPMVSADQTRLVDELVDDAVASGAERLTGGPREVAGPRRPASSPRPCSPGSRTRCGS